MDPVTSSIASPSAGASLDAPAGYAVSGLGAAHVPAAPPPSDARGFLEALGRAREQTQTWLSPPTAGAVPLGEVMGLGQLGDFAQRLSDAQRKNLGALESLTRMDPLAPEAPAQIMGVMASMTQSSIQTEFTGKFASRISDSFNRLLTS